jgi:hypothetical protein
MYLSDNNRIWTMGSIILPVALASAAILPSTAAKGGQILILGSASTLLVAAWNLFADHHRAFQTKSLAWMEAIERSLDLPDPGSPKAGLPRWMNAKLPIIGKLNVRRIRWSLAVFTGGYWAAYALSLR